MKPLARTEGLTIRELPDEVMLLDPINNQAHCLNHVAATVWRLCDGTRTFNELAVGVTDQLDLPVPEAAIELALEQLTRRGLLITPVLKAPAERRMQRREALRVAAHVLAIPLMMTIASPARAFGVSQCIKFGKNTAPRADCPKGTTPETIFVNGQTCYSGKCVETAKDATGCGPDCTEQTVAGKTFCSPNFAGAVCTK
jgi:hypothetical protein